jgi:hypothetical protein
MFILSILYYGYNRFIDLLMEGKDKNKKYTDKDVIIRMVMYGIILFLCILSMYYIPYIALILVSMSK